MTAFTNPSDWPFFVFPPQLSIYLSAECGLSYSFSYFSQKEVAYDTSSMDGSQKEQDFLALFDMHVDALFSYCFSQIPDRVQSHELIEKTFKRGWDQITEGKKLGVAEFYKLLDESITTRIGVRGLFLPTLLGHLSVKMRHSS